MDDHRSMRRLSCLALALVTLATYWRVIHNGFVNFDDDVYVTDNPWVNQGLSLHGIIWAFTHFYAANWHPLTWISHMLDCQLFGINAGPQHVVNVFFHAANVVLLFLLLNRLTGAPWRSGMVAALFAVHPLHVESVAWIAERKDLLCTFFGLLALLAYIQYAALRKDPLASSRAGRWPYLWALIFFALGLMSKPMLVTLPFLMVLLDFWPLERMADLSKIRNLVLEKWPFFGLTLIFCLITWFAQRSGNALTGAAHSTGFHVANALVSYVRYIEQTFWPAKLAVIYPLSPISFWQAAGAGIFLLLISTGFLLAVKQKPYLLMGWLWYLGALVPVIGLVQVGEQSLADRYMYIPIIGLFVICIWSAADLLARWQCGKQMQGFLAAVILFVCAVDTTYQLQFWRNSLTLFNHTLAITTNNALAQNDFATALAAAGDMSDAFQHYAEAARLAPDNAVMQNNFGVALAREGQANAAIARYEDAIRIQTNYPEAYSNLGSVLAAEGRYDQAISLLNHAVSLEPGNAELHENLAVGLLKQGKPENAVEEFHDAILLSPQNAGIRLNFGLTLFGLGDIPDATQQFSEAVRINPESPEAQFQLGRCLAILHQPDQAIDHLRAAIQAEPDWPEPLNALAWILATDGSAHIRNGTEAVQLAKNAATLSQGKDPAILSTLAAAYAEAGQFDEAINTANQAIALAQQSGQAAIATQIRSLLALYQKHRAFHHA